MFRSAIGRKRRSLWAILSCLFAAGFVASAFMVRSERNQALESVVERARDEAQLATASLTGKQLTKPITGSTYDRLAAKIWKSVSSEGSISGVTIWSSRGRIIFSLNESRVGNTPADMRSLITEIANGSDSTRVLEGDLQTFTRISKATDGPVAVVQVDQPFALVETQTGGPWSTVRLVSAVGLAVCLLLLGITFVPSVVPARAQEDAEPERLDRGHEADEADETKAEGQPLAEPPPTDHRATYAELFGLESDLHAHAGISDRAPDEAERPSDEEVVIEAQGQPSAQPISAQHQPASQPPPAQPPPAQQPRAQQPTPVELPAQEAASSSEEDIHAPQAERDEAMAQVETFDADGQSPGSMDESIAGQWPEEFRDVFRDMARGGSAPTQEMRQRREEFKNRAKQAELRLKKQDEELDEAPSSPSSER